MTVHQFFNNLKDNPIVLDYLEYMNDTTGDGYIPARLDDGNEHYNNSQLPNFKYHNVQGHLAPVNIGADIKSNLIKRLFGSTKFLLKNCTEFGEFTGSISAGSYGIKQGWIRPYNKSKDSDRNEQWTYVVSVRTGKKFLASKNWVPMGTESSMSFYHYLALSKSGVRTIQKESQRILGDAFDTIINTIQDDALYLEWKEKGSGKTGDNAKEVEIKFDLMEIYRELGSKVGRLRLDQEDTDEVQCSIRNWGKWDHDYEDSDMDDEDYEDDDNEVLSDNSYSAMDKIVKEISAKYPQSNIDWGTSEKNWIDFTITRIANESVVTESKNSKEIKELEKLLKSIKSNTPADQGRKASIQDDIERLKNESLVTEASYGGNEVYEISTPAPKSMLKEELEELFGDDYRNIVTEYNSPEGLESVLMFNITKKDIAKIESKIGDVLIFSLQLGGRKSII